MEVWGGNEAFDNAVTMPGLDAWVYSRPYKGDEGGGDVHYVSSCATGRVTRILVADVSGHGHAVAAVARSLRSLMRRYVNYLDQSRLVRSMNQEFAALAEMGNFATAVVATYWCPTGHLVTCNAGHPRPLLRRAATGAWQLLHSPASLAAPPIRQPRAEPSLTNLPRGVAEPTGYDQFSLRLAPGDMVLLYTDSLIESRDTSGTMLGERGLLDLVSQLDAGAPERFIAALTARLRDRAGGADPDDDVTVLLLRHTRTQPPTAVLRGLAAPFRIFNATLMRLRLGPDAPAPFPEFTIPNIVGAIVPPVSRWWKPRQK
jgi:hypothetical protein